MIADWMCFREMHYSLLFMEFKSQEAPETRGKGKGGGLGGQEEWQEGHGIQKMANGRTALCTDMAKVD
jgi:hypothetical protein